MPRPTSISLDKIIRVAREVFLEQGSQATTAEVAKRAGVAEGTLFYKFKSKFGLFRAAMAPSVEDVAWIVRLHEQVGKGDLRQNLIEGVRAGIAFYRSILPLLFMSWSNQSAAGLPEILTEPDPPPLKVLRKLTSIFDAEMRAGRLARKDPEVVARMFMGAMMQYVVFEMILAAQRELPLPVDGYARDLVDLLWSGARPPDRKRTTRRTRHS